MRLLIFAFFFVVSGDASPDCARTETMSSLPESRLLEELMCGYKSHLRPVRDHRSAVEVDVTLIVNYVTFDQREESLTVHSWIALRWKDEFLTWDPSNYGGLDEIMIESHKIWSPELSLYNEHLESYDTSFKSFYVTCQLKYNGTVTCVPAVSETARCTTYMRQWPYDTQKCPLQMGSWTHAEEQINFKLNQVSNSETYTNEKRISAGPGWSLDGVDYRRTEGKYSCCPNTTYPSLVYTFTLSRHVAGIAALIVVPATVVIILSVVCLLLDNKDYIRLSVSCFSLLGHFVIIAQVGQALPKHTADTPILLLFLRDSMILSLVGVLLTLLFYKLRRRTTPPPPFVSKLTAWVSGQSKLAVYTAFEPDVDIRDLAQSSAEDERSAAILVWIDFCNILNTAAFLVIIFVYLILLTCYLPKD